MCATVRFATIAPKFARSRDNGPGHQPRTMFEYMGQAALRLWRINKNKKTNLPRSLTIDA
jgi:hypothetical protein